jgi:alkylation response protein AidB-like acyl-CoA dehydrogenase
MDFSFSVQDESYRSEVRAWLRENVPGWWRDRDPSEAVEGGPDFDRLRAWHATLFDAGYVGVTWPREYGGQGRTHVQNAILQEELVRAKAPPTVNGLGIGLCGPAIIHHGSEAQKRRFLRPMLRADELWCQGYSEPAAGSDLANLQTRAALDAAGYLVNGQKIWTSLAHVADWIFCLVRTDPKAPKHDGIGFLLIDMHAAGIEVAPLVQMTGGRGFSQVFFKDVRVPRENLVGGPTEGWRVANTVLGYERGASSLSRYAAYQQSFERLAQLARSRRRAARSASQDPVCRQRLADLAIRIEILRLSSLRQLTALARGVKPGPESSLQKLCTSELEQALGTFGTDLQGAFGQLAPRDARAIADGRWQQRELGSRAHTIFAGTSEIQRNIIAERVLGLPRA